MSTQLACIEAPLDYDDGALAALAERAERHAWKDIVAAAPHSVKLSAQLFAEQLDGVLILASRGIRNPLFNRAIGLGEARRRLSLDRHGNGLSADSG
jgi:hypothetical protein